MNLTLTRKPIPVNGAPDGTCKGSVGESGGPGRFNGSAGTSSCDSGAERGVRGSLSPLGMATLENAAYLIPPGTYRIAVTYSPRFKRPLPLVCDVIGAPNDPNRPRSGIRFHRGSKPEHSKGCILLRTTDEVDSLCTFITTHAPVTLKIING